MSDAFVYAFYINYIEGCSSAFWKQWVGSDGNSGWWQEIQKLISLPWIAPTIAIVFTASNILIVSFQTVGFN